MTPSQLLRQDLEAFHFDMALGYAETREASRALKMGTDDMWQGIASAVAAGIRAGD